MPSMFPVARQFITRFLPQAAAAGTLCLAALLCGGCFPQPDPGLDREARVLEALRSGDGRALPPSPLSPAQAVAYALEHNLDSKVAEIETDYQNETLAAAKRRLLPSLTARYSVDHTSHPAARWSQGVATGRESLESSFSSEQNAFRGEIGLMWNLLDFGVGYLKAKQQLERVHSANLQRERIRQQVTLDVLSNYWRASFTAAVAAEAEALRQELEAQAASIRDSVDMRILSGAEGARRELVIHNGLSELEQWRRAATQAKLELARVMGCGNAAGFELAPFPEDGFRLPAVADRDPGALQTAALKRRPELYQSDAEERIALDDARTALLQMAPNASLSLSLYDDPDQFLEWNNWMTVGARVSWNLFAIPARLSERRAAKLQGDLAREKGLALAAAVMAQVGIAWSDWRLTQGYAESLRRRAGARARLVDALAAGREDGQARAGEVLQERVRLLTERAAAMRAEAEAMIAGARLANAVGVRTDAEGAFVWEFDADGTGDYAKYEPQSDLSRDKGVILAAESEAAFMFPGSLAGVRVVKAEEFTTPDAYFEQAGSLATKRVEEVAAVDADVEAAAAAAENPDAAEDRERIARDVEEEGREREEAARRERARRRERLLRGRE